MKTVLAYIHDTYSQRCGNPLWQKSIWRKAIVSTFPPDLAAYPEERPSLLLAGEGGDLGCALLWIVQAALVRPFLTLINHQAGLTPEQQALLTSISTSALGELAHSEPRENPVVITPHSAGLQLNGVKKYITAGRHADFILGTAREPDDEKISRLLLLPISDVRPEEMETLDLKGLYTISHGRLTLKDKTVPLHYRLPLSPELIRKTLKVNSLVERSLIMEAVLALMVYLNERIGWQMPQPPTEKDALSELLPRQTEYTSTTIEQAGTGAQVQLNLVDLHTVGEAIENICNAADDIDLMQDMELVERINDLRFMRSLWA